MPRPPWYNENRNRAYPFQQYTVGRSSGTGVRRLPDETIVDCGFVFGALSGYDGEDVYLARVSRAGDTFRFDFACDAPILYGQYLSFCVELNAGEYVVSYSDSSETHGDSFSASHCDEALWYGFVVFGELSALADLVANGGVLTRNPGDAILEPSLLQSLVNSYVKSFALANADRTYAAAPDGCENTLPTTTGKVRVWSKCLQGTIFVKPGFNASLRQNPQTNTLTFVASVGAGEGQPCGEVPTYPGETVPAGSSSLEGGPQCNEVLRSVNGVGGPALTIVNGLGVSITPQAESNSLIIDINGQGLTNCTTD